MVFFAGLGWLIWNVETWTYRLVKSRIVSYSAMMLTGIGIFALATALLGVKL
ncbi:MAG: hypothetical protein ACTHJR_12335 [Sphingomonas sp.]|uniref:hypothetical protein n=1 Tax=Sphingomonas sp. TaxID=28214 RepID=UPI003F7DEE9B